MSASYETLLSLLTTPLLNGDSPGVVLVLIFVHFTEYIICKSPTTVAMKFTRCSEKSQSYLKYTTHLQHSFFLLIKQAAVYIVAVAASIKWSIQTFPFLPNPGPYWHTRWIYLTQKTSNWSWKRLLKLPTKFTIITTISFHLQNLFVITTTSFQPFN